MKQSSALPRLLLLFFFFFGTKHLFFILHMKPTNCGEEGVAPNSSTLHFSDNASLKVAKATAISCSLIYSRKAQLFC